MSGLNDCFKIADKPIKVEEAIGRFLSLIREQPEVEVVSLGSSLGRILAKELVARHNLPLTDNSAVDGYLVYYDDLNPVGETRLKIVGRIAAGHPLMSSANRGEALKIFTGASIPHGEVDSGPDTICMLEDVQIDNGQVVIPSGILRHSNLRKAGEDIKVGEKILDSGHRLRPQDISMAASLGYPKLSVFSRLKVAVFSSGDEIQDIGGPLRQGKIYDANRYSLIAMLKCLNVLVTDLGILEDNPKMIEEALSNAAETHDLVITSGGVSKGEEDHIKNVVKNLGYLNFWNLAIKPGRPIALGYLKSKIGTVPFIGLPGNPVAVMVTFLRIARPLILRLAGSKDLQPQFFRVKSGFDFEKKAGRRELLRAHIKRDKKGDIIAIKHSTDGSGIISSMVETEGLIELSEDCQAVKKGDLVDFLPFNEVM